jgi:hypothetical protein
MEPRLKTCDKIPSSRERVDEAVKFIAEIIPQLMIISEASWRRRFIKRANELSTNSNRLAMAGPFAKIIIDSAVECLIAEISDWHTEPDPWEVIADIEDTLNTRISEYQKIGNL